MRVLVTGVSGFVGRHLTAALQAAGHEVHGLGLGPAPPEMGLAGNHVADLARVAEVEAALAASAPEAVVNLAGQASAARSFEDPFETFRVNTAGALTLLEAVRRAARGARVVLVGSGESYGPQPPDTRVAESAPFRPVSPYALSKAAADSGGAAFALAHRLDVIRTRSFAHSGPGQDPRFVIPSFAQQIARFERGEAEPVLRVGNLEVVRDISDVRDVALAYVALVERGVTGAAYNVCRGEGIALSDLTARMCERARVPVRVEVDPARVRAVDVPYLVGDPSAIARDTGWTARIPLDRMLEDALEDWRGRT